MQGVGGLPTMHKAVILVTSAAKQHVKRMQALFSGD